MPNESLLDALAQRTAADIVDRHAGDFPNRQALLDAITRLARRGLEAHVRLWQQSCLRPVTEETQGEP